MIVACLVEPVEEEQPFTVPASDAPLTDASAVGLASREGSALALALLVVKHWQDDCMMFASGCNTALMSMSASL